MSEQEPSGGPRRSLEELFGAEPPLLYHGGLGVQHSPKLFVIFWGKNWEESTGSALRTQLLNMYKGLSGSAYQGILTQYFDGTGRVSSTLPAVASFIDKRVPAPTEVNDKSGNSKIQKEIEYALSSESGTGWTGEFNAQFVVIPAPGSTYEAGFDKGFCGYHGVTSKGEWSYTFYPYIGDEPFKSGCAGFDKSKNVDNVTSMVAAHEYAESATDPHVEPSASATWYTNAGYEIADICATGDDEVKEGSLKGSWVQGLWDNNQGACSLSDPKPADVYAITEYDEPTGATETKSLLGTVYAEKLQTSYYAEYGLTEAYGQRSSTGTLSASTLTSEVRPTLSGLVDGELYHYRLVASNSTGIDYGKDHTFRTGPYQGWQLDGKPIVEQQNVKLTGEIELLDTLYEQTMTCGLSAGGATVSGTTGTIGSVTLTSCSVGGGGLGHCKVAKAESVGDLPWAIQLYETVDGLEERVRLAADGKGAPQWKLECAEPSKQNSEWRGEPALRVVDNSGGEVEGQYVGYVLFETEDPAYPGLDRFASLLFKPTGINEGKALTVAVPPLPAQTPAVTTLSASDVIGPKALLEGSVNPRRQATSYYFEYGKTTAYGSRVPKTGNIEVGSGVEPVHGVQQATGLEPNVTYHYRLVASNSAGTTHGEDKTLTTPGSEWRLGGAAPFEPVAAVWKGTLKLTDKGYVEGKALECEDTAEGTAALGGTGEVTKWTVSKCSIPGVSCETGTLTVEPVNLPWHTELVSVEGATRELISSSGKGSPGYKWKCKVLGITFEDECTGVLSTSTTNTTSGVSATFNSSEKLNCTKGGSGQGSLEGTQAIEAAKGGKLSAITAAEAGKLAETEWKLGGAALSEPVATAWKGTLKLTDKGYGEAGHLECEDTAEGPVGLGANGEVTKLTVSKCVIPGVSCETATFAAEQVDLPWHTELVSIEGVKRDVITGGGKGLPGYKWKCKVLGITFEDECTGALSTNTTNTTSGVSATFNSSEKLHCTKGGAGQGSLEGTQTIEATKGGKLEVK